MTYKRKTLLSFLASALLILFFINGDTWKVILGGLWIHLFYIGNISRLSFFRKNHPIRKYLHNAPLLLWSTYFINRMPSHLFSLESLAFHLAYILLVVSICSYTLHKSWSVLKCMDTLELLYGTEKTKTTIAHIFLVLLSAVAEECYFRLLVFEYVTSEYAYFTFASLSFTFLHFLYPWSPSIKNYSKLAYYFFFGCLLAGLQVATNSPFYSFALHLSVNLTTCFPRLKWLLRNRNPNYIT